MNSTSVTKFAPAVKPVLRPIGEVKAVFPSYDPAQYLSEYFLDYEALSMIRVEDVVLAQDCRLTWPPRKGIEFAAWLRNNEVQIMTQKLIRKGSARRGGRWYGRYLLILGVAPEVGR